MCEFAVSSKLLCETAIFIMGTPKHCIDSVWAMNANYLVWMHPQSGSIRFAVASEEMPLDRHGEAVAFAVKYESVFPLAPCYSVVQSR